MSVIRRALRTLKTLLAVSIVLFLITGVAVVVLDPSGPEHCSQLEQDLERLRTDNLTIQRANDHLERQNDALRNDPRMIEQVAREELGMIRPGEVIYRFQR